MNEKAKKVRRRKEDKKKGIKEGKKDCNSVTKDNT